MKRLILLSVALMLGIMLSAQTQQGYVKTKGRLANDGSVIAGTRIPNATIQVKGRTSVISQANGTFSFPIPDKSFYLTNVQKQGYVLTDPEILSKQYTYSANDLIIVMEDLAQQEADRRAIERKISSKLYSQLQQRGEELESLKEQNKITEKKYRELLQKLNQDQDDNEKIIKDMAERYTKMDFDQIDEFNRKVSEYILNGELMKADSMLNSKGNLTERSEQLKRERAANAKERDELDRRQANLQQSEAFTQAKLEDLANDCYQKFEIYKMRHEYDSAAYYIELRAGLDKTNTEWFHDLILFVNIYATNYNKALELLMDDLEYATIQNDLKRIAIDNCNIGIVYKKLGNFDLALQYMEKGLETKIAIFGNCHLETARTVFQIGSLYYEKDLLDDAMEQFQNALATYKSFSETTPIDLGDCYLSIGNLYCTKGDYEKALEYMFEALSTINTILGENHPYIASCYNNIGLVYSEQGNYGKALEYYNNALAMDKELLGENHKSIAIQYNNIATTYYKLKDFDKAIGYFVNSLGVIQHLFGDQHPKTATLYTNIGTLYSELHEYNKAIEYLEKGLLIRKNVFGDIHSDVANSFNNIAFAYFRQGNYTDAIVYFQKALEIFTTVLGENHPTIAIVSANTANAYFKLLEYNTAILYYTKALNIYTNIGKENHPNAATYHYNLGILYTKNEDYNKALGHFNKALSIDESIHGIDHPSTIKTQQKIAAIQAKLKEPEKQPNE